MPSPQTGAARALLVAWMTMGLSLAAVIAPAVSAASSSFNSAPGLPIPDNGYNGTLASMASDTINASAIPPSNIVTDVTVTVAVTHTWVGDLTIKLRSPSGTTLALVERPQGDGATNNTGDSGADAPSGDDSNVNVGVPLSFSDAYVHNPEDMGWGISDSQTVCFHDLRCQFAPYPDAALVAGGSVANFAAFDGELARGDWTLGLGDSFAPDVGTFASWSITIGHTASNSITTLSSSPNIPIPDDGYNGTLASMANSTIDASTIPAGRAVTDVSVQVAINHTWVGDLTVKLLGPTGVLLTMVERPDGDDASNNSGDNGADDPLGDSSNVSASFPLSFGDAYSQNPENMGLGVVNAATVCQHDGRCHFKPNRDTAVGETSFAAFDGELASGIWRLLIGDGSPDGVDGTFVSWTITIKHALPLNACGGEPFTDVPASHPFCAEIKWMKDAAIATGFPDGAYQPSAPVTRMAMSAFMARLAGAALTTCVVQPFTDVPTGHPFCAEIKWMKDTGISTGFSGGAYQPSAPVTRMAMSAFMARLAGAALTSCAAPPFDDVPVDHPFCAEIKWMNDNGISTGFPGGGGIDYRPSAAVTRQAMSAFMYRVSAHLQ